MSPQDTCYSYSYVPPNGGNLRDYTIRITKDDPCTVLTTFGESNGKQITTTKTFTTVKNAGRSNETSPAAQAQAYALRKYNECVEKAESMQRRPMLAHDFMTLSSKARAVTLSWGCYALQPKIDGYRCILDTTKRVFFSRTGKEFYALGLLAEHICSVLRDSKAIYSRYLDGEIVSESGVFDDLGLVRRKTPLSLKQLHVTYIVYDMYGDRKTEAMYYSERFDMIALLPSVAKMRVVETTFIYENVDPKRIQEEHDIYVGRGYEGLMLRNGDGLYTHKRSFDLLKYKMFQDDEFVVVDYDYEVNDGVKCILWVIETPQMKVRTRVRPKGSLHERHRIYKACKTDPSQYIGRKLWCTYFGMNDSGSLRMPSTKTDNIETYFRDEII